MTDAVLRWEYAQLRLSRDPSAEGWPTTTTFITASAEQPVSRDVMEELDALGAQGWELLGAPEGENAAYTTPAGTRVAGWVSRRFWLRRPVRT